jgi:nucleoside-diphosphate-sugar epimerase
VGSKITENDPLRPRSVYAQTKVEAEKILGDLAQKTATPFLIGRVFGLISPSQPPFYVLPGLIRRVKERNFRDVPGLDYVRDYLDARDVCRHIAMLCDLSWDEDIINICSGEATSIRDLMALAAKEGGVEKEFLALATAAPGRADDIPFIVGDPARLLKKTHATTRQISLFQTVKETFLKN